MNEATIGQLQNIDDYFDENGADQENQDLINQVIDNIINDATIVETPNNPINDMADYLSCFDTSNNTSDATITIYADQPEPNNPKHCCPIKPKFS